MAQVMSYFKTVLVKKKNSPITKNHQHTSATPSTSIIKQKSMCSFAELFNFICFCQRCVYRINKIFYNVYFYLFNLKKIRNYVFCFTYLFTCSVFCLFIACHSSNNIFCPNPSSPSVKTCFFI